jgi:hypothetical protein
LFGLANLHHRQKEGDTSASVTCLEAAKSPSRSPSQTGKVKKF